MYIQCTQVDENCRLTLLLPLTHPLHNPITIHVLNIMFGVTNIAVMSQSKKKLSVYRPNVHEEQDKLPQFTTVESRKREQIGSPTRVPENE